MFGDAETLYLFIFLYFKRISKSIQNPTLCAPFTFTLDQSKATIKKIPEKILPALFYKNTWCEDLQAQSTAEPTSLSWLIHRQHPDRKKVTDYMSLPQEQCNTQPTTLSNIEVNVPLITFTY